LTNTAKSSKFQAIENGFQFQKLLLSGFTGQWWSASKTRNFKNERGGDAVTSQPRKHILTEDFQIISRRCVREYRSTIFGKSFSMSPENRRQNGFLTRLN